MPAQVPVRNAQGAFVPHTCPSLFAKATRVRNRSRGGTYTTSRSSRLKVAAGQKVNQLEADKAAEATPLPQEQGNGSTDPRQKAQRRGMPSLCPQQCLAHSACDSRIMSFTYCVHAQLLWIGRMPSSPNTSHSTLSGLDAQTFQSNTL